MPPLTPAPLRLRFAAAMYDLFPLIGLWMVATSLVLLLVHGEVDVTHPSFAYRSTLRAILLAITAAYFVISWSRGGQTIGMRAWRVRVIGQDGRTLPWPRALLRFVIALAGLAALGMGFLWCLGDPERRGWHDLAARSIVARNSR